MKCNFTANSLPKKPNQ